MACTTIAFGHPSEPPRFGLHDDDDCTKPPSVEVINFTTSEVVIIMRNESRIIKILMIKSLKKGVYWEKRKGFWKHYTIIHDIILVIMLSQKKHEPKYDL